ncbi:MAG: hypothetical protein K2J32_06705 [Ruminococcus sp.]|nr:hypothetical protein [Ruminococcus sp.]
MNKIAECLTFVEELKNREYPCVIVNLLEVMEKSLKSGAMDDLSITKILMNRFNSCWKCQ